MIIPTEPYWEPKIVMTETLEDDKRAFTEPEHTKEDFKNPSF